MPLKQRSTESRIAEHEKFRKQCLKRIRPSLVLCAIAVVIYVLVLWTTSVTWLAASWLVLIPVFLTAMEIFSYFRHDRAIRELRSAAGAEEH